MGDGVNVCSSGPAWDYGFGWLARFSFADLAYANVADNYICDGLDSQAGGDNVSLVGIRWILGDTVS